MLDTLEMFNLAGKTALVSGAANGLGHMIAMAMAEAGANVVCADINETLNYQVAEEIEAKGLAALAITCDVSDESQVKSLFSKALSKFGTVDIVFANAGIADTVSQRLHESSFDDWQRVIDVNLNGVFLLCKEAVTHMVGNQSGKIITTASMWGLAGTSSVFPLSAYAATKGAVVNFTREIALQYAEDNIQINCLCPGFFRSRLAGGAYDDEEFVNKLTEFTPMKRIAEAQEIKGSALYLASAASSYTTGAVLLADGGCLAK